MDGGDLVDRQRLGEPPHLFSTTPSSVTAFRPRHQARRPGPCKPQRLKRRAPSPKACRAELGRNWSHKGSGADKHRCRGEAGFESPASARRRILRSRAQRMVAPEFAGDRDVRASPGGISGATPTFGLRACVFTTPSERGSPEELTCMPKVCLPRRSMQALSPPRNGASSPVTGAPARTRTLHVRAAAVDLPGRRLQRTACRTTRRTGAVACGKRAGA